MSYTFTTKALLLAISQNALLSDHVDVDYFKETLTTTDRVIEEIEELISQAEVIYYSNAIEYLNENDPSLKNSLEIAHEMGYEVKNLNSEILATLLLQASLQIELQQVINDLNGSIFNKGC